MESLCCPEDEPGHSPGTVREPKDRLETEDDTAPVSMGLGLTKGVGLEVRATGGGEMVGVAVLGYGPYGVFGLVDGEDPDAARRGLLSIQPGEEEEGGED